jgi:hypothetical protein
VHAAADDLRRTVKNMVRSNRHDEVVRITSAAESPSVDLAHRQRRYLISMAVRTLCFIGAVLARHIPWLCALLIVGAFLLPYVAVIMANTASPRLPDEPVEGPRHRELE